jgi:hypothetical protein
LQDKLTFTLKTSFCPLLSRRVKKISWETHPLSLEATTAYSAAVGWMLNWDEQEKSVLTCKS